MAEDENTQQQDIPRPADIVFPIPGYKFASAPLTKEEIDQACDATARCRVALKSINVSLTPYQNRLLITLARNYLQRKRIKAQDRSSLVLQLKSLESMLRMFLDAEQKLSSNLLGFVVQDAQRLRTLQDVQPSSLINTLTELRERCLSLLETHSPSVGAPRNWPLRSTALQAAKLYENITGASFAKSINIDGPDGEKEFTSDGAHFVFVIMNAIDSEISVSSVRSALRQLKPSRQARKSTNSSARRR